MHDNYWLWLIIGLSIGAFIAWLVFGGKLKVTKEGFEVEIEGVLGYLREAAKRKGTVKPDEVMVRRELYAIRRKLPTLKVLWVDDNPTWNLFERLAFASAGVFIDSYTNNGDAISVLEAGGFELVISDLNRTGKTETGWELLNELRRLRPKMPFVFYVSHIDDEIRERVQKLGADITNDPAQLVQLVLTHVR